ncbi:hypothetical protein BGX23_011344 [Mortierella sp. AD031]|nr:hypothetical protein BGX23_011344 [Mortierella sp. AD031]
MEFVVPNLLDWASSAAATSSKTLQLSVTLICAGGVKDISDPVIAFDMVAVEDSETELLHTVVGLHRQLIHASLTAELDLEAEQTARKRTLALLNLDRPPSVTRSEHLALGVIYMLCDGRDLISDEGMDIVRGVTQDGHDMLHLAVILGLKTLVRELARHLLGTFQSCAVTSESEVFTRDPNGLTALDFATILGDEEIEKVLTATLQAAQDHKRSILGRAHRPLPSIPPPQPSASPVPKPQPPSRASTLSSSPVLSDSTSSAPATETLDRPLPPTPLTSPYKDSPPAIRENHSYFPVATTSIDATIMTQPPPSTEAIVSTATVTTAAADHHPDQRIHTVQAIVEDGGKHDVQYHGAVPLTTMDHGPALYPGHNDAHVVAHQYPTYQHHQHQPHHDQHHQWQQQQQHHHQQQYYPHHQKYDYQQQHQEHYQQPLHSSIHHAPTLPSMPHLQSYGHNINPRPELPTPPRANSVPIPRPNNQHVPHHPQQPQQQSSSPLLENHSPSSLGTAGSYRPQPPAPLKAPSSLPPPKHIVTRVNRPKNFVVPTSTSETLTTTTGTTSMPLPEIPQHRPMMIPPLLPHPHAFPGANGHHHPMPVPAPVPVPMPMPMNHGMPQRHDSHGPRHNGDQIKVPVV